MIGLSVRIVILICICFLIVVLAIYISLPSPGQIIAPTSTTWWGMNYIHPLNIILSTWTGDDAVRRASFCSSRRNASKFRNVCTCENPAPITFTPKMPEKLSYIQQVPVLIIAANRPNYLFRSLTSILKAFGVHKVCQTNIENISSISNRLLILP